MPTYRVYLGAPKARDLDNTNLVTDFHWMTTQTDPDVSRTHEMYLKDDIDNSKERCEIPDNNDSQERSTQDVNSWILPPATLSAVGERLSQIYKNVIFRDEDEDASWAAASLLHSREQWDSRNMTAALSISDRRESQSLYQEREPEGTPISWPPTDPKERLGGPSTGTDSMAEEESAERILHSVSASVSFAHTSTSSIGAFPSFHINPHGLSSLASLATTSSRLAGGIQPEALRAAQHKVSLLAAVLDVEGPDYIVLKRGPEAGREVAILRLIVGDGDRGDENERSEKRIESNRDLVCRLTAWREVAEQWGEAFSPGDSFVDADISRAHVQGRPGVVKRGDIVYLENILASLSPISMPINKSANSRAIPPPVPTVSLSLTASPNLSSSLRICYRSLPAVHGDKVYRPDLRLASSDLTLRHIARIVKWFETVAGVRMAS